VSNEELEDLRKKIDALDGELLKALAKRMDVVREIGRYKKSEGLALRDDERLQALLAERLKTADGLDLPRDFVKQLYELIHEAALDAEANV
jgi:chorismate mutase